MSKTEREIASGIVALIVLVAAVLWGSALAVLSLYENVEYVDAAGDPHLRAIWRSLVWLSSDSTVPAIFATFVTLLAAAAQLLSSLHRRAWTVILVAVLCLIGIAASAFLMSSLSEPGGPVITTIRAAVGGDESALLAAINRGQKWLIGWYVAFLALQLGINLKEPTSAVRSFITGLFK